ncbi:Exosome component 5 [Chamberlinius hualienensis]
MENEDENISLRRMLCEQGTLSRASGSSTFCQGNSVVVSSVHGPSEKKMDSDNNLKINLEVVFQPKSGQSGCYERLIENLVKKTCESIIIESQYPRSQLAIMVQETQCGGSTISCSTNAACLALIDAGVAMRCLAAAVTCVVTSDKIIVDPSSSDEKLATANLVFTFESQTYKVISSYTKGLIEKAKYQECLSLCRNASKAIFSFYQDAVRRKLSKST